VELPFVKTIIERLISLWGFINKLFRSTQHIYSPIPKRTIILAPDPDPRNTWWYMGSEFGEPAMQVVGRFKVTNITKFSIVLVAAKMRKPKYMGHVLVKDSQSNYHGEYQIPPGGFTDLDFHFCIIPPFKKEGEPFFADIAILDQFGNEHWIKEIQFIYIWRYPCFPVFVGES
jgi:hypothetical protein